MGRLVKVVSVESFITPAPPHVPVISCNLEDGRQFVLYYVPLEITIAINKLLGYGYLEDMHRESVFELLPTFDNIVRELDNTIERVVIDELDRETYLYTATLELRAGSVKIKRKMIPSHAIYLALLTNKPIYVDEELVEQQAMENAETEEF